MCKTVVRGGLAVVRLTHFRVPWMAVSPQTAGDAAHLLGPQGCKAAGVKRDSGGCPASQA
jgi:hypothetical protein